jgi:Tfp pilus assembly protein PilN
MHELLPAPVVFPLDHQPEAEENEGPPVDPHRGLAAHTLPYATALAAACPWQGISSNLLPVSMRRSSSRMRFVPTLILLAVLLSLTGALVAQARYEKDHYGRTVLKEIQRLEPSARRLESLDREISHTRARTQLLDDFRRRSKADMDALSELTRLLPPPTWVNALEIRREGIQLNGETEQAAALIKVIDGSPMFENTEFTMPYARGGIGEIFGIRASRRKDVPKP